MRISGSKLQTSRLRFLLLIAFCLLLSTFLSGCGYTTKSLLPARFEAIYIETFANKINITSEVSDGEPYRLYPPGLEIDLTNEVIDKFIYDGNLQVANKEDAHLILRGEVVDYIKQPLRYAADDEIEEYRINIAVNISLFDVSKGELLWEEKGFTGDTSYLTTTSLSKTETAARTEAIQDLARRIVERTIEAW